MLTAGPRLPVSHTVDHPLLTANQPNLITTPHFAWASRHAQQRLADEIVANIAAFQRGETHNHMV